MSGVKKFTASPTVQLTLIVLASVAIYIFAFLRPGGLLEHFDEARLDLKLLFREGTPAYVRVSLAFIGVWALYLAGYRISSKVEERSGWVIVLVGMVAFIAIFLFVAPFDAADIYDNIMHGRILGIHHANPFQQVIAAYPDDPFYEYAAWKRARSAYGPLWESLAGITARIAGDGIIANVLAFKFLPGLFHIAIVALVVLHTKYESPKQSLSGALLVGWNPMVLYETWGNGHNDTAMVFWFLAAAWFISRRRFTLAALSIVSGGLIKFLPILLIPAVLLIAWRSLDTLRARSLFLVKTGAFSATAIFALYYPFWNGLNSFSIERRMNMFTASLPSAVYRWFAPSIGLADSARLVSFAAFGLLAMFVIVQSFRIHEKTPTPAGIQAQQDKISSFVNFVVNKIFPLEKIPTDKDYGPDFLQITFNILAFYLLVTCLWFQQWYSVWLICLAPLVSSRSRNIALVFGFWVVSKQLVFGPHFANIMFYKPTTAFYIEPIFTATVLGVPWLYALWTLFSKQSRENVVR